MTNDELQMTSDASDKFQNISNDKFEISNDSYLCNSTFVIIGYL